jgi:hypothetical protein
MVTEGFVVRASEGSTKPVACTTIRNEPRVTLHVLTQSAFCRFGRYANVAPISPGRDAPSSLTEDARPTTVPALGGSRSLTELGRADILHDFDIRIGIHLSIVNAPVTSCDTSTLAFQQEPHR